MSFVELPGCTIVLPCDVFVDQDDLEQSKTIIHKRLAFFIIKHIRVGYFSYWNHFLRIFLELVECYNDKIFPRVVAQILPISEKFAHSKISVHTDCKKLEGTLDSQNGIKYSLKRLRIRDVSGEISVQIISDMIVRLQFNADHGFSLYSLRATAKGIPHKPLYLCSFVK